MLLAKGSKTKHKPLQQEPEPDSKFHSSPSPPDPAQESPESNTQQGVCCWIPNREVMCPAETIHHFNGRNNYSQSLSPDQAACLISERTGWEGGPHHAFQSTFFFFLISHFSYKAWRNSKGRRWLTPRRKGRDVRGNFQKSSTKNPSPGSRNTTCRRQRQISPTKKSRSIFLLAATNGRSRSFC